MEPHTLKAKIGEAEFEASGAEATVQKQYELWLQHVSNVRSPERREKPDEKKKQDAKEFDQSIIARAFAQDDKGIVSLKGIPQTDDKNADALILMLYGFKALKGQDTVLVTQLAAAARKSGVNIERIDRTIAAKSAYHMKAGARRGGKYSLNNQGELYAEQMLLSMFNG